MYEESLSTSTVPETMEQKPEIKKEEKITTTATKKTVKKSARKTSKKAVKKTRKVSAQKLLDDSAKASWQSHWKGYAPTILRVFVGITFLLFGAQKLFGALNGPGLEGVTKMFSGLPVINIFAAGFAFLVAIVEFFGGIALILGIFTRLSGALLAFIMLVAMLTVNMTQGFFPPGGIAYPLILLASSFSLFLLGPGNWALWDKL